MTPSLLLIDALNLIRRIYAVDSNQNQQSDQVMLEKSAERVARACTKLINISQASHGVAVLDGDKSWRYHFYSEYKSSRAPMPALLNDNLTVFKTAIEETGITVFAPEHDEADDVIATLAHKAANNQVKSIIVSTDKGFLPSLSEYISLYDYFKRSYLDSNDISSKFGVEQHRLIDFWALAGDKTNDIPGVKGIGNKTAQQIINRHADITCALTDESLTQSVKDKLNVGMDNYILSKHLVTLRTDIQLGFSLKQLRLS